MKRKMLRLTAKAAGSKRKAGYYPDGGGLYLQVIESGGKSWLFRFALNGRERQMGLGPIHTVTLVEARSKAVECRKLLLDKIDPIEARDAERAARSNALAGRRR
jgi:Arm domain-containing DNA-binding protein